MGVRHVTDWGLQVTLQPGDAVEVPAGVNHRVTPSGSPVGLVTGVRGGTMADVSVTWLEPVDEEKLKDIGMEPIPADGA
jgi:mannose-6-phosphate isomerase-like protein (cupin superfamily)